MESVLQTALIEDMDTENPKEASFTVIKDKKEDPCTEKRVLETGDSNLNQGIPKKGVKQYMKVRDKGYACGWCKFRAQFSKTVVRHHYARHTLKELDIIKEKKDPDPGEKKQRKDLKSSLHFNCNDCSYTSALRHKLQLYSETCHSDSSDKGGITDYDSDTQNCPVYPQSYYNKGLNDSFYDHQREFNLREMKVECDDIFQAGTEKLEEILSVHGVTKICVDSLSENMFVSLAVQFKHSVSYLEKNRNMNTPIKLRRFNDYEIRQILRGGY